MPEATSARRLPAALVAGAVVVGSGMVLLAAAVPVPGTTAGQNPAAGRSIEARDGDLVVVRDDARVRIVRRRDAVVRAVFNAQQQWLVLLVDQAAPNGPDGRVEMTYTFNGIEGAWPLEERWEGPAVVEDYSIAGEASQSGVGFLGPQGLLQVLTPANERVFRSETALAVLSARGFGRGGGGGQAFDAAEQQQVATAMRNAASRAQSPAAAGFSTSMTLEAGVPQGVSGGVSAGALAPVRVGGTIRHPVKLVDVQPVMPDEARAAGIRGVVILELIIGADGTVTSARVLRSIPLLDNAAVTAARQWRYEPTLLNGQAVPVILTATVNFQ